MVRHRTNGVERRKHTLADRPSAFRLESPNANGDIRSENGAGQRDLRGRSYISQRVNGKKNLNIQRDVIEGSRHL